MDSNHQIVVGLDFGTTYTAVAWADSSKPSQVEIIRNWPTAGQIVGHQVPSEIAYDGCNNGKISWGYNIDPKLPKIKWFKLNLEIGQDISDFPPGLTSADVISDFLSAIYNHVMKTLGRRIDEKIMGASTIAFVLTVPAIWSDAAKKVTENAAMRAGMGHLQILSEPECASIYTLKTLDDINSIRVRDRVLVCDAGGGTVDLISYDILSIDPLSIVELTAGSGDYCGSTFIDREFEKLFVRRMGSHYQHLSLSDVQQAIKNFESVKTAFRDESDQDVFRVGVPTVGTLEDAGIYGGNFLVTRDEMRSLFDPVVDQIIGLLAAQASDSSISSILLVGGFGESEYLYRRISSWASQAQLRILQPREASTAIVRGAVMKGLELAGSFGTQVVRRARRWYGVTFNEPYVQGKHHIEDRIYNVETGQILARNQVSWFIKKNQMMEDDQIFHHSFRRDFRQPYLWKDHLVCCSSDSPPCRLEPPVTKLCTITSDLTNLEKSLYSRKWRRLKPHYTAHYLICLGVKNSNLTFFLSFRGTRYGVASVEFD